ANSLAFCTRVYGPPLFDRYYAAEIPFGYGQAFPGLIYLPVWTFQAVSDSGYDEILRSHEIAHQWWGIGVEPAGYRDVWLSEGFAEFSGWWYMQIVLQDNAKFFKHLDHWRREIRARRNDAPPTGVGSRTGELHHRRSPLRATPAHPPGRRPRRLPHARSRSCRAGRRGTRHGADDRARNAHGSGTAPAGAADGSGVQSSAVGPGGSENRSVGVSWSVRHAGVAPCPRPPSVVPRA